MKRITLLFLLFLAACTAETAVEPMAAPTETAVPPTATIVMEAVEPTAVTSTSFSTSPPNLPSPTEEPTPVEPTQLPPTRLAPTAVVAATEVVVEYGRTEEGAFFKGAAGAPVTLIDYSDFL
jgi:hypothetical protein